MRRKLFCLSLAFIFGIWTSEISITAAAGIVLAASFYAFVLHIKPEIDDHNIRRLAAACAVFIALGAARALIEQSRYPKAPPIPDNNGKVHIVTAKVINVEHKKSSGVKESKENNNNDDTGFALTVDIIGIDNRKCKGINIKRCLLSYYVKGGRNESVSLADMCVLIGSVIRFSGKIDIPEENRNPRCFNYRMYLKGKKTAYISSTKHIRVIDDTPDVISKVKREIIILRERFIDSVAGGQRPSHRFALRDLQSDKKETQVSWHHSRFYICSYILRKYVSLVGLCDTGHPDDHHYGTG